MIEVDEIALKDEWNEIYHRQCCRRRLVPISFSRFFLRPMFGLTVLLSLLPSAYMCFRQERIGSHTLSGAAWDAGGILPTTKHTARPPISANAKIVGPPHHDMLYLFCCWFVFLGFVQSLRPPCQNIDSDWNQTAYPCARGIVITSMVSQRSPLPLFVPYQLDHMWVSPCRIKS